MEELFMLLAYMACLIAGFCAAMYATAWTMRKIERDDR